MSDHGWRIYRGAGDQHPGIDRLPDPPPWRRFSEDSADNRRLGSSERATSYRADEGVVDSINAALMLRRPLLVTGKPGTGKSTLAYSIAYELGLEPVLHWPITSRTSLNDGLYNYDAIGRVHENSLRADGFSRLLPWVRPQPAGGVADIGRYIRLGALGTALLPSRRPRVLLIDELDKSDIDLPNDLLNVFEEGQFTIPELQRLPDDQATVEVMTGDGSGRFPIIGGVVQCSEFPIVIITSNGEREFPPAFLRRCIRAPISPPGPEQLAKIVTAHFGEPGEDAAERDRLIRDFLEKGDVATDQLLNAIFISTSGAQAPTTTRQSLIDTVMRPLNALESG